MKYEVDFQALKARVSMEAICHHYNVALKKGSGGWLSGDCILPSHPKDVKRSFKLNTENDKWHCKAESCVEARDGRAGGDSISFVALVEKCSYKEAGQLINSWFPVDTPKEVAPVEVVQTPPALRTEVVQIKAERYMEELDKFLRELLTIPEDMTVADWKEKVIKKVKARVLESYRQGKAAASKVA